MLKTAASDEASQHRCSRYIFIRHRREIAQEFHKTAHFPVFRTVLRHGHQHSFRIRSDHRELHDVRRIEEHVSVFLVRIDPLHFRTSYIRPVHYGFAGSEGSLVEIPKDTADQTVVTGRNAVMVIQGLPLLL